VAATTGAPGARCSHHHCTMRPSVVAAASGGSCGWAPASGQRVLFAYGATHADLVQLRGLTGKPARN